MVEDACDAGQRFIKGALRVPRSHVLPKLLARAPLSISNTDANFLNLHIDKATKTRGDKQLYLHTFYETNFIPKLFTAKVECNGIVLKEPKTEKAILFKLSLNDGDLVFWITFNLAVHFQPKIALALEILSD